jgi:hypothetical protein
MDYDLASTDAGLLTLSYCPSNQTRRVSTDDLDDLKELKAVHWPLASLEFCNTRLRASQPLPNLLLRHARFFPGTGQESTQAAVVICRLF